MTYSNAIVWIDDASERKPVADELRATFVDLPPNDKDIYSKLEQLLGGDQPRLVILDHFLNSSQAQMYKRGSTFAEAIKDKWPTCPVIGITAAPISEINERTREAYDDLFDFNEFAKYLESIHIVADGFEAIAREIPLKDDKVSEILRAPKGQSGRLKEASPELLKRSEDDMSIPSTFYRWVHHLHRRPGFLYDFLWTATFLGVNEKGFGKLIDRFDEAKYAGVFFRPNDPRWWSAQLAEILYKFVEPLSGGSTWHAVRAVENLEEDDFSKCHKCGDDFPEIVAYEDSQSINRYAMHLECTVLHPKYKRELYFEDIRMMDGD